MSNRNLIVPPSNKFKKISKDSIAFSSIKSMQTVAGNEIDSFPTMEKHKGVAPP